MQKRECCWFRYHLLASANFICIGNHTMKPSQLLDANMMSKWYSYYLSETSTWCIPLNTPPRRHYPQQSTRSMICHSHRWLIYFKPITWRNSTSLEPTNIFVGMFAGILKFSRYSGFIILRFVNHPQTWFAHQHVWTLSMPSRRRDASNLLGYALAGE